MKFLRKLRIEMTFVHTLKISYLYVLNFTERLFMGCSGCSSGRGNSSVDGVPAGCNSNGACGTNGGCNKLNVFDWLGNMSLPNGQQPFNILEVRFKNSRKEFFKNVNDLQFNVGDVVAVEASPGYDIGIVSLTGELVKLQLKKKNINFDSEEVKKLYRKAKQADVDKWKEAQALEVDTMYRARTIALQLGLEMKLSDVEFQGDKSKAIFYYTADARVDFRELIKVLAQQFGVRIEMKQIGARQEASRLGGIGACGRELCCSTWLTDFRTVSTSAARYQQLSLNPLKLAGQCGKLKCCLNYELDSYQDALKEFPELNNNRLQTKKGEAFLQKTDIFKRTMWFSYRNEPDVFIPLKITQVKEVLEANKRGEQPDDFKIEYKIEEKAKTIEHDFDNVVGQDSLTRFDKNERSQKPNRGDNKRGPQKTQNKKPNTGEKKPQNTSQNTSQSNTQNTSQSTSQNTPQNKSPRPQQNNANKLNGNKATPAKNIKRPFRNNNRPQGNQSPPKNDG
jgi:cell fate regulator YaaT (PSP1 superfamily)